MMDHLNEIQLSTYLDGGGSHEERKLWENHLSVCEICLKEIVEVQQIMEGRKRPPQWFEREVWKQAGKRVVLAWSLKWIPSAAAILLTAALGFLVFRHSISIPSQKTPQKTEMRKKEKTEVASKLELDLKKVNSFQDEETRKESEKKVKKVLSKMNRERNEKIEVHKPLTEITPAPPVGSIEPIRSQKDKTFQFIEVKPPDEGNQAESLQNVNQVKISEKAQAPSQTNAVQKELNQLKRQQTKDNFSQTITKSKSGASIFYRIQFDEGKEEIQCINPQLLVVFLKSNNWESPMQLNIEIDRQGMPISIHFPNEIDPTWKESISIQLQQLRFSQGKKDLRKMSLFIRRN